MMSEKETTSIRKFVCGQLRDEPDLSTLTLGTLKKQYLALIGQESLRPEARTYMKKVVEEELMKMQDNEENESEPETKKPQKKRKREKEKDEVQSGTDDESRAKKSRCRSSITSESEDEKGSKTGREESAAEEQRKSVSEDSEQEAIKSKPTKNKKRKVLRNNVDSDEDKELKESGKKGNESNCSDGLNDKEEGNIENTSKNVQGSGSSTSPREKTTLNDEESETDGKSEKNCEKINGGKSSDDSEKEEKVEKSNSPDSDSDSLPSLEDDKDSRTKNNEDGKKKKTTQKQDATKAPKEDNHTVVRLKRYISLCGVRRNYKKLLEGCRSVRAMVTLLKKELEDLGVDGKPSIKKCKSLRKKREEAQELAELDVTNIIATQGRPKRKTFSAKWEHDPPSSTFKRTLNSASDSDQENNTPRVQRRTADWGNLRGIISDDADSD